ncbi:MAG: type II toxin-antitoxin system VapC family toxin [Nevskia sp.]|nr:type II toxin-antitoxin system VapC family toxin [Nevskia sp.]
MKLLLDTHVLIWAMEDSPSLSEPARALLEQATASFVSAVSIWEMAIKSAMGKLQINLDRLLSRMTAAGFQPLPITWAHARAVRDLPLHHRDPFDRMLIAQTISEPLVLLTHDEVLCRYSELVKRV